MLGQLDWNLSLIKMLFTSIFFNFNAYINHSLCSNEVIHKNYISWISGSWVSFLVLAQDPKSSQASTKISANTVQKPAAYRPPHAKSAAAVQAEVCI